MVYLLLSYRSRRVGRPTKAGFNHVRAAFCRCAIVHGDVTPGNIFFDLGYNALLGDIYHGDEPSEDVTTHTITTNADCSLGYEDRYKSAGDRILVSKDLFSLGIGLLFAVYYSSV